MKFEQMKELISLIDQSSLTEFEYQNNDVRLRLSKNDVPSFAGSGHTVERVAEQGSSPAPVPTAAPAPAEAEQAPVLEGKVITSPIVGVVYLKPNPDSPTYVSEGDQISEGQVLCLVEAMKIMNEIKSEHSGQVVEILVENEQVVEYNQPLFRIL
ncbi:acetyl-CoA carboxylase biotin carboxyl carrier protein [Jeotgalibaca caeni]|uniref:acetyl-CoA carboxylase biotin carboxyl carrier protein n=1 Tax=Jeotgalibaca caeni TaxID=3028623 RepID=UPI00237E7985|nr:acetyl-CoA carboxylase biotin carboxyl carrier protein [Jeotgalibaca caeni]MDE1547867.1 acetyl-CoA carboxylase biotin carboxyl carrier protein [Jeotgalibaca caeni]